MGGNRPAPELMREAHDQPVTAESVLTAIMTREPGEKTATEGRRESWAFPTSMPHLHKLRQMVTREQSFPAYDKGLMARLTPDEYRRYLDEPERPVLHHQLRRAELAGADIGALLDRATSSALTGAQGITPGIPGPIRGPGRPAA